MAVKGITALNVIRRRCKDYEREHDDRNHSTFHSIISYAEEQAYAYDWCKADIMDALRPLLDIKKGLDPVHKERVKKATPKAPENEVVISTGRGVEKLLDGLALLYHDGDYYKVLDTERKVVARLRGDRNTALQHIEARVFQAIGEQELRVMPQPRGERWGAFEEYLQEHILTNQIKTPPVPFQLHDGDDWCFHRCDVVPRNIPTPTFDEYGTRTSSWELLKAFIGGVACGEYRGKAMSYIYGARGDEGKSTLCEAVLETLFGRAFEAIDEVHITSRFGTSALEGKAVAYISEASNPYLIGHKTIKALTTKGERVYVERKGITPESKVLDVSILVGSNKLPIIEDLPHFTSRLLFHEMTPYLVDRDKEEVIEELHNEMEGILYKCLVAWEQHRQGTKLVPDAEMIKRRAPLIEGSNNEQVLSAFFTIGNPKQYLTPREIHDVLLRDAGIHANKHNHFMTFLRRHKDVKVRKVGGRDRFYGLAIDNGLLGGEDATDVDNIIPIHPKLHG